MADAGGGVTSEQHNLGLVMTAELSAAFATLAAATQALAVPMRELGAYMRASSDSLIRALWVRQFQGRTRKARSRRAERRMRRKWHR